jgi:hypothetical protein
MLNRGSAQPHGIDSCLAQVINRLGTEELAAHLVVRLAFPFEEQGFPARLCEPKAGHSAGKPAADH